MKRIYSFNILGNKKAMLWINVMAMVLFICFIFLFALLMNTLKYNTNIDFDFIAIGLTFIAYGILIVIHELIHGLFMKLFNPTAKVKFGFKNFLAYATAPGTRYPRLQFLVILLSPFVWITVILFLLVVVNVIHPMIFVIIGALHASGCVGDFYMSILVLKAGKGVHVEDTEAGIDFYQY